MPISITVAALGGEIEIPTLDGYAKIKVPAGTQTGQMFRLRNKGIKGVRSTSHGGQATIDRAIIQEGITLRRDSARSWPSSSRSTRPAQDATTRAPRPGWTRSRNSLRSKRRLRGVGGGTPETAAVKATCNAASLQSLSKESRR